MRSLNWEEFKKILNKINTEHKVILTPIENGRLDCKESGKSITTFGPLFNMLDNTIPTVHIFTILGEKISFDEDDEVEFESLYDYIINWLDNDKINNESTINV